jgi:hypothetical protein
MEKERRGTKKQKTPDQEKNHPIIFFPTNTTTIEKLII